MTPDQRLLRWEMLWQRIAGRAPGIADLVGLYSEPHRRYHALSHVDACLEELQRADLARESCDDSRAVELALWFHDAVYDPRRRGSPGNEDRSAALAAWTCGLMGIPAAFAVTVSDLILQTKHGAVPEGRDAQMVSDIDLSILGADRETFDRYEVDIRFEYSFVPEDIFRKARADILRGFLARDRIYFRPYFAARYEAAARANIVRSIAALDANVTFVPEGIRMVGVTGCIGAGKSTIAGALRKRGYPVIDADELALMATDPYAPAFKEIAARWPGAITPDGHLDRKKLARIVFSDGVQRLALESLIHPRIAAHCRNRAAFFADRGERLVFYDAPLLVEAGAHRQLDGLIVVTVDDEMERVRRVVARDGCTEDEAKARALVQLAQHEKAAAATWVIRNDHADLVDMQIDDILAAIRRRFPEVK